MPQTIHTYSVNWFIAGVRETPPYNGSFRIKSKTDIHVDREKVMLEASAEVCKRLKFWPYRMEITEVFVYFDESVAPDDQH